MGRNNLNCLHTLLGFKLTVSNYSGKKWGSQLKFLANVLQVIKKGSKILICIRNQIGNNLATCLCVSIVPSHHGICESFMKCH